jgi:hypothetical protein
LRRRPPHDAEPLPSQLLLIVVVDGEYSVLGVFHVGDFDRARRDGERFYKVDFPSAIGPH